MSYEILDKAQKGELGEAKAIAAKVLLAVARSAKANGFVKITSAHISGINYYNIGESGLELLRDISREAKFVVPTSINPCGAPVNQDDSKFPLEVVKKQKEIYEIFMKMGALSSCTCVPYEGRNVPKPNEHVSWAESSAVVYGNSVLGIYTNKEGGLSALASAILGFTPNYGMHLDENRKPKKIVKVNFELRGEVDYGALGYYIGSLKEIVGVIGIEKAKKSELKALSASIGTYGPQPMFVLNPNEKVETIDLEERQLKEIKAKLTEEESPQAIVLGCPFLSAEELREFVRKVNGKRFLVPIYLFVDKTNYESLRDDEKAELINSNAKVYFDVCPSLSFLPETLGYSSVVTNSFKHYFYTKHQSNVHVKLMDIDEIIENYSKKQ